MTRTTSSDRSREEAPSAETIGAAMLRSGTRHRNAHTTRFNLLLLEDGEYFLDDYSVHRFLEPTPNGHRVQGRLKVCTRGFFFVPQDLMLPILRFPFRAMLSEPFEECFAQVDPWHGASSSSSRRSGRRSKAVTYLTFQTKLVIEMKERGVDHPYVYRATEDPTSQTPTKYIFTLQYSSLESFLKSIHVIYEVANLPRRCLTKIDEERLLATVLIPRLVTDFDSSLLVDFRERLLLPMAQTTHRIEPLLKYPGALMLTDQRLYFQPAHLNNVLDPVLNWEYTSIAHLYKRRYLLRQTGLEISLKTENESVFFSFESRKARDDIYDLLVDQPELMRCQRSDLTAMMRKWQARQVSNYEYLLFLNNAAGRTRNDLTQYPVFPWILQDYTSTELDLDDPFVFRDLSKPIGAINEDRLEYFRMRYESMPRGDEAEGMPPPFLYGTHYSTPGYVLYYLVRMAPQYMLCLQSGKFDEPDRLFRSIQSTWEGCRTNHTDLKELIPEFFDTQVPADEWLTNDKHLDLGTTQNLTRVGDVELPPWAHGDPNGFVRKNRDALESEYVSNHLHHWIDLIFGYQQQGEEAVLADNLFYYLSYEGAVDLDLVLDPIERCSFESQIQEFGQTPKLLFSTPHPSRNEGDAKSIQIATPDLLPSPRIRQRRLTRRLTYPLANNSRLLGRNAIEMHGHVWDGNDPNAVHSKHHLSALLFMCFQASWQAIPRAIGGVSSLFCPSEGSGKPRKEWHWDSKLKRSRRGVQSHRWKESLSHPLHSGEITSTVLSHDGRFLFTTCKDSSLKISSIEDGSVRRHLSCELALSCCDISPDESLIFLGCWDNRVYMHSIETGQPLDKVFAHSDGISAICVMKNRFLTSSWDSTVKLWRYTAGFIVSSPVRTFLECDEGILCLDASANGAFGAGGARNGHVYLFDLHLAIVHADVLVSPTRRGDVSSVSFAADSRSFICMTLENEIMQFNLDGEQLFAFDTQTPGQVRCFESDGEYAVGGSTTGAIYFWKLHGQLGQELIYEIPKAHDTIVCALAVSANGSTLISGAMDGSLHVWKLQPVRAKRSPPLLLLMLQPLPHAPLPSAIQEQTPWSPHSPALELPGYGSIPIPNAHEPAALWWGR